jgi:hypothetical protein
VIDEVEDSAGDGYLRIGPGNGMGSGTRLRGGRSDVDVNGQPAQSRLTHWRAGELALSEKQGGTGEGTGKRKNRPGR